MVGRAMVEDPERVLGARTKAAAAAAVTSSTSPLFSFSFSCAQYDTPAGQYTVEVSICGLSFGSAD